MRKRPQIRIRVTRLGRAHTPRDRRGMEAAEPAPSDREHQHAYLNGPLHARRHVRHAIELAQPAQSHRRCLLEAIDAGTDGKRSCWTPHGFVSSCNATSRTSFFVPPGHRHDVEGRLLLQRGRLAAAVIKLCQQHKVPWSSVTSRWSRLAPRMKRSLPAFGGITPVRKSTGAAAHTPARAGHAAGSGALRRAEGFAGPMSPPIRIAMWSGPGTSRRR